VVAIIVLLSCTAAVWWGMANIGLPNPSEVLATHLIEQLEGDGDFSVHIDSVGRDYLKRMQLKGVSIAFQGKPIGTIDELSIPGGLGRILASYFSPTYTLRIEATGLRLDIDQGLLDQLTGRSGDASSSKTAAMLERVGLLLDLREGTINANLDIGSFMLRDGNVIVDLRNGLDNLLAAGDAAALQTDLEVLQADIRSLHFGYDEERRFAIEAKQADTIGFEAYAAFENLVFILQQSGEISLSLANLTAERHGLEAASEQASLHASLAGGLLADITLSVATLTLSDELWSVSAPGMTIVGSAVEDTIHSLALASQEGGQFFVHVDGLGDYQAEGLSARFSLEEQNILQGSLSLSHLNDRQWIFIDDLTASVRSDDVALTNLYGNVQANVEHRGWPLAGDWIASAVEAEGYWQRKEDAVTASLSLTDATSNLLNSPVGLHISLQGRRDSAQLESLLFLDSQLELRSVYNLEGRSSDLIVTGRLTDLAARTFSPLIDRWAPFLKPYTQDKTTFNGNISFTGALDGQYPTGRLSTELAMINARMGSRDLDAGFTILSTLDGQTIDVSSLTLAAEGYRLSFAGKALIDHWLPSGDFALHRIDDGQLLGTTAIQVDPDGGYTFAINGLTDPPFFIDGMIKSHGRSFLSGEASLHYKEDFTPFGYSLALDTLLLSANQEDVFDLYISLTTPQSLSIAANRFRVPGTEIHYSGAIEGEFKDLFDWTLSGKDILLEGISFAGQSYDLAFRFDGASDEVTIPSITIYDGDLQHHGSLFYRGLALAELPRRGFVAPLHFGLTLTDAIRLTVQGDARVLGITLDAKQLPVSRFGQFKESGRVDISLVGETNLADILDFDAVVNYEDANMQLGTSISAEDGKLNLFDTTFKRGALTYTGSRFTLDGSDLVIEGVFDHLRHLSYKTQPSHAALSLSLSLGEMQSFFGLPKAIEQAIKEGQRATLTIGDDLLLFGEGGIAGGTYALDWDGKRFVVDSELFSFSYEMDSQHFTLEADRAWGIGVSAYGSLAKDDFGVVVRKIHFPLTMLNRTFLKPVFLFHTGIAEGEIFLGGTREAIKPYGQLHIKSTEMYVFWLPDDLIHMKGVSVTVDGERATTGEVPFFSTNTRTTKTVQGYGDLSAHLDGLSLLNYEIHAYRFDHPVYVWIPMAGYEADISGYVQGTFNLFGIGFETWLDGDLVISDMNMTLGIKDLPYWYEPAYLTTTSFNVTTAKGVNFFYPNTPTPIIRATLTENQRFSFTYDHLADQFEIDGNFAFRSGELYYFQKNFLITEGQMVLHTDALSGRNTITPRINLRAKISDFDVLGNRVDIFLVLRDSTLTNLNPIFESVPAKEVNEIMEILGQSILPTGAYGEIGLYSVASLAAAATDVAERLGYLEVSQTTQLTETIRISLGLDMFSIRSNIVQNILFDALPVTGIMGSLSPIARYLHNTSVFMGKYVGEQFFLQALIHLSAMERSKVRTSFLSPDLSFDLELSLDWENPLSTVSFFTQPSELSFTNILDTMGFSVTKRIVLR